MSDWSPSARQLERERVARRLRARRSADRRDASTIVVAGLLVAWSYLRRAGRGSGDILQLGPREGAFPAVRDGFWLNVRLFLVAEPLILVSVCWSRSPGTTVSPWLTPLRALAVVYTDLFRGVPTLLVVFLFAFGIPALRLQGVTNSLFWLGLFAARPVLRRLRRRGRQVRASTRSIPPNAPSAEALALSRSQSMRYVVLPQALRRVVPPLMNDFVSPAEGHRSPRRGGCLRGAVRRPGLRELQLQLHSLPRGSSLLRGDDDPPGEVHRLAERSRPPAGTGWQMSELLLVEGLRKSYGDKVSCGDIDLTVNAHDVICLIGASGSGKSTLLRCLNLLDTIDDGTITFAGREVSDPLVDPRDVRREIGMVFQAYNLFPHLTVLDNCMLAPVKVHGVTKPDARERALTLLGRFGLADKADAHPDALSGGQQQRAPWSGRCARSRDCCCSTRSPPPSTPSLSVTCWRASGRRRRPG